MIWNIMQRIASDMREPFYYLPYGIAAGVLLVTAAGLWQRLRGKRIWTARSRILCFLYGVYGTVCAWQAFFSRLPGSRTQVDLELFGTIGKNPQSAAYFVENILMCIPLGILLPLGFRKLRRPQLCILAGMLFSITLEVLQLVTQRGYFQLDDMVTNTLGTVLGWLVWRAAKSARKCCGK